MTVSSFPVHRGVASVSTPSGPELRRPRRRAGDAHPITTVERAAQASGMESSSAAPLVLAAVLCLVALLVAPEQPRDQEAICQRHNGVAACRVW